MSEEKMDIDKAKITYVQGVEGSSIYLNDYRIAGPKPWGGGKIIKEWDIELTDVYRAAGIKANADQQAEIDDLKSRIEAWKEEVASLKGSVKKLEAVLSKVNSCPYSLDPASIPKDHNLDNPQVVGSMSMARSTYLAIGKALSEIPEEHLK